MRVIRKAGVRSVKFDVAEKRLLGKVEELLKDAKVEGLPLAESALTQVVQFNNQISDKGEFTAKGQDAEGSEES